MTKPGTNSYSFREGLGQREIPWLGQVKVDDKTFRITKTRLQKLFDMGGSEMP